MPREQKLSLYRDGICDRATTLRRCFAWCKRHENWLKKKPDAYERNCFPCYGIETFERDR